MQRSIFTIFAMTSALLSCAPAFAQDETRSIHVNFSDLNLASNSGAAALQHRLASAIDEVCGVEDRRDLNATSGSYKCRADAKANAEAEMSKFIAAARSKAPVQTASLAVGGQ